MIIHGHSGISIVVFAHFVVYLLLLLLCLDFGRCYMVFQKNKKKRVLDVSEYVGNNFKYGYSFQANQRGIC